MLHVQLNTGVYDRGLCLCGATRWDFGQLGRVTLLLRQLGCPLGPVGVRSITLLLMGRIYLPAAPISLLMRALEGVVATVRVEARFQWGTLFSFQLIW